MWYIVRRWRLLEQPGHEWPYPSAWAPPETSPVRYDQHLPLSAYRAALIDGELSRALEGPAASPGEVRRVGEVWLWTGSSWQLAGSRVLKVRHPTDAQRWTFERPGPYYRTGRAPPAARRWTTTPTGDGPHAASAFWLEPA